MRLRSLCIISVLLIALVTSIYSSPMGLEGIEVALEPVESDTPLSLTDVEGEDQGHENEGDRTARWGKRWGGRWGRGWGNGWGGGWGRGWGGWGWGGYGCGRPC